MDNPVVGSITPWSSPQGGIQDPEDLLHAQYGEAVDAEVRAGEEFAIAFHNWEMGEAGMRIDLTKEAEESGKRRGEAWITASLKLARRDVLSPLWEAYQSARVSVAKARAMRKKIEGQMSLEKSRSYRKRM